MIAVPNPDSIDNLVAEGYQLSEGIPPHTWYLSFNMTDRYMSIPEVREAVNLAMDREGMARDLLRGSVSPAYGVQALSAGGYVERRDAYERDLDKARQLLASVGLGGGFRTTMITSTDGSGQIMPAQMAEFIQQNLAEIGIDMHIQTQEWISYLGGVGEGHAGRRRHGADVVGYDESVLALHRDLLRTPGTQWPQRRLLPESIAGQGNAQRDHRARSRRSGTLVARGQQYRQRRFRVGTDRQRQSSLRLGAVCVRVRLGERGVVRLDPSEARSVRSIIGSRLLSTVLVLLGVSLIVFLLAAAGAGRSCRDHPRFGRDGRGRGRARTELGLDRALPVQFVDYLGGLLQGDLGRSLTVNAPVTDIMLPRFANTLILTGAALVLCIAIAVPLGVIAAHKQYSIFDRVSMMISLAGASVPVYWFGLLLIGAFAITLGWLPTSGMYNPRFPGGLGDLLARLVLPAIAAALVPLAVIARMTRSVMIDILQQDYIRTLRASGLSTSSVLWRQRAAQCAAAGRQRHRAAGRLPARRCGVRRGGVRLAGSRSAALYLDHPTRHPCRAGRCAVHRAGLRDHQPHRRRRRRSARSPYAKEGGRTSTLTAAVGVGRGMIKARPGPAGGHVPAESEIQKPQWRLAVRAFGRDKVALVSLILLVVVALAAIFAPLLTTYSPTAGDPVNRLAGVGTEDISSGSTVRDATSGPGCSTAGAIR